MLKKSLLTLFLFFSTQAFALSIMPPGPAEGRYELKVEGNRLIMDLDIDGNMVSANFYHYASANGEMIDRHYQTQDGWFTIAYDGKKYIELEVLMPVDQAGGVEEIFILEGWISEDGMHIGGIAHPRTNPLDLFPWSATRVAGMAPMILPFIDDPIAIP